jgi:hypothetical protein
MVSEIVADGQIDPVGGFDEGWAIGALLNLLEHVIWTDATSEQDLWSAKGTGGQDDSACSVGQLHRTNMSSIIGCNDIETRCMTTDAVDSLNTGI